VDNCARALIAAHSVRRPVQTPKLRGGNPPFDLPPLEFCEGKIESDNHPKKRYDSYL